MSTLSMSITRFGGFSETTALELDLAPPVSAFMGVNGAGKSTLFDCLRRTLGDTSAEPTRTRDTSGAAEFILESQGSNLTLRLNKNLSTPTAAALAAFPVRLAGKDVTRNLENLIGPDDQSESNGDAARGRRLVALASIAGVAMTRPNLEYLASGLEVKLDGWKRDDVASVRLELYSRLTAQETVYTQRADRLSGEVSTHTMALSELPDDAATDPGISILDATAAETLAIRAHGRAQDSHADRLRQLARREAEQALTAPVWSPSILEAMEWLQSRIFGADPIDADFAEMGQHIAVIGAGCTATRQAVETWRAQRSILEAPITGTTEEDVAVAATALDTAAALRRHAETHTLYLDASAKLTAAGEAEAAARASAKAYRTAATTIPARLATLIQQAGLERWGVDADGDVAVRIDGAWIPYATRSRSERIIPAIVLVASRVVPVPGTVTLILIADTRWAALTEDRKEELALCLEPYAEHVHLVTEAPTEGPLRIGHPSEGEG